MLKAYAWLRAIFGSLIAYLNEGREEELVAPDRHEVVQEPTMNTAPLSTSAAANMQPEEKQREDLSNESETSQMPSRDEQAQQSNKRFTWLRDQINRLEEQNEKLAGLVVSLNKKVASLTREISELRAADDDLYGRHRSLTDSLRHLEGNDEEIRDNQAALKKKTTDLARRLEATENGIKDVRDERSAEKLSASGSLSVAGSDDQPRLIAEKLKELRTQNTRRVVSGLLSYLESDGDRRMKSAWVGDILSNEIYIKGQDLIGNDYAEQLPPPKAIKAISHEILNQLGLAAQGALPSKLVTELEQLIAEGLSITYKALKAKPSGTLWIESEGATLDTKKHEVMAGCPDIVAESKIQFTSHPGYKVNDTVYLKALVYTNDSPSLARHTSVTDKPEQDLSL
jgi:molecular chaperone GrpE (heat shock protein)